MQLKKIVDIGIRKEGKVKIAQKCPYKNMKIRWRKKMIEPIIENSMSEDNTMGSWQKDSIQYGKWSMDEEIFQQISKKKKKIKQLKKKLKRKGKKTNNITKKQKKKKKEIKILKKKIKKLQENKQQREIFLEYQNKLMEEKFRNKLLRFMFILQMPDGKEQVLKSMLKYSIEEVTKNGKGYEN